MCGFAGIVGESNPSLIRRMTGAIAHRGPDGEGYFTGEGISLGHRRLAIIDLAGGAQPMTSDDGRYVVVYNGEVYNHEALREELEACGRRFHSHCDTEVVLQGYAQWGPDVVRRLRGMFAFAVWDAVERHCFLARDHMGVKPLYYAAVDGRVYFASELKGILADPRVPRRCDLQSLDVFLNALMYPADLTAFEGIRQLEAGHTLSVRGRRLDIEQYYRIPFPGSFPRRFDEREYVEGALVRAEETVNLRRMSDVPIGVFLSGGVDSSLVTMLLARAGHRVRTFSLVHDGDASWLDESPWIRRVVECCGTEHRALKSDPAWSRCIPELIRAFDQPCTTSINSFMISRLAASEVKVVLTGTGGDEAYAGYARYLLARPSGLGRGLARGWARSLLRGLRGRVQRPPLTLSEAFRARNTYFDVADKRRLYTPAFLDVVDPDRSREIFERHLLRADLPDALSRCLHTDQMLYLINNLHNNLDKVSMAHGLEARVPLCDYRFLEYANAVPSALKLKNGELKYVLKEAACRVLPREVIYRPKRGFGIPLRTWMRGEFADCVRQVLRREAVERRGLFRWEAIGSMLEATTSGRADYSMKLWMLMVVELWHRLYVDSDAFVAPPVFEELAA